MYPVQEKSVPSRPSNFSSMKMKWMVAFLLGSSFLFGSILPNAGYCADPALTMTVVNNSGFADTEIFLTAPCHKPLPADDDNFWGYINFATPSAPVFVDTGTAADFQLNAATMSFTLATFKDTAGNYTINFPQVGGGRLYFSFGDNFDQCGGFSSSGPLTDSSNPVIFDMMEFYLNPAGTPNLDISRVDFFGISFYFATTNAATGAAVSRGHIVSRDSIINSFAGFPDNGGILGNTALFNTLVVTRPVKDGISNIRVASPKDLGYSFFETALPGKGPQICSHFYDSYVNNECWAPNRTFTSYDKNNYAAKSPVYYCKVSADGTYLNIYTDAAYTIPYSGMPTMIRPSNSTAAFPTAPQWHAESDPLPNNIDWGFIIMGSVNPAPPSCAANYGLDPVSMFIMAALARGTLHRNDPSQWLTNVLSGDPTTGQSTVNYPIFYYGKILHENSIDQLMYALSYDDVGGQATDVSISTNATATVCFNAVKTNPATLATLTMAVTPSGSGTTSPAVGTYTSGYSVNDVIQITATAATGYYFTGWTSNSNATITDRTNPSTTATITATTPTVTANFAQSTAPVTLTMAVSPAEGGTTTPTPGDLTVNIGQSVPITASAASGYYFTGWTITGNGEIKDITSPSTTGDISAAATFTATFSQKPVTFMANGSVIEIDPADLKDAAVTEFTSKPSVTVLYTDPIKNKQGSKAGLTTVTPASKKVSATFVYAALMKNVTLYNKKNFSDKTLSLEALIAKYPVSGILSTSVSVKYKLATGSPVDITKAVYISPPVVTTIGGSYSKAGDIFVLSGKYFGSALPSIYLEYYTEKDSVKTYKRIKCKVLKKNSDGTSALLFENAKGKANSSCMKVLPDDVPAAALGFSEIQVQYPSFKQGTETPTGFLMLVNGSGLDVFNLGSD